MKNKGTVITFLITGVLSAVLIGIFVIGGGGQSTAPTVSSISGLKTYDINERTHTPESVTYEHTPAVAGKHDPTWANCVGMVYEEPLRTEKAVHSLEHGAVWITYKPDIDSEIIDGLKAKVTGRPYLMMSPVADQTDPVMMAAWNNQLSVTSAEDERVDQFIQAFAQSPQAPEPGAPCSTNEG